MAKILGDAYGFANVKSRANRQSVPAIITSAQQRLKLYNKVPANGLILYTGTIISDEGKEKMVAIDFEAFKPISASLCVCDNKFRTKALNNLLESDDKFGFIVMDENGTLLGTLSGNTRKVLCEFTAILRRAAEFATQFFINATTSQLNVSGLILASPADFIAELSQSDMFDPRLQVKILNIVNVPYGGENGFDQAIELSSDILSNVKFVQQKRLIRKYFEEISQDTGKYVFGVEDTLKALELGAVQTLIVWENLEINRYVLKSAATGEISVKYLDKGQEGDQSHFRERGGSELEVQEKISLLEWFANEYRKFGCAVEFVANNSR